MKLSALGENAKNFEILNLQIIVTMGWSKLYHATIPLRVGLSYPNRYKNRVVE
jgi:hypothetical protein